MSLRRHTTGGAVIANVAPFCARTATNHKILPFDGIVLDPRHKVLYAAASTCCWRILGGGAMEKVRCANEEACVAFPSLGEPAKLSRGNPGPMCFRCEERDFDVQQSQLVRSTETSTEPLQPTKPINPPRCPTRNVGRKIEQQLKEPDPAAPVPDKVRCSCGREAVTPGPLLSAKWVCELCAEWDRVLSALWHCREIIPRIEGRVVLARRQGRKRLEHLTRRLLEDTKADLALLQEELREVIHKVYPGPYNREKREMFLQYDTGLEDVQSRPQQAERVAVPTPKGAPALTFRNRTFAKC